jgi:hypothetical protein
MKKLILAAFLLAGAPALMTSMSSCSTTQSLGGNTFQTVEKVANVLATAKEISGVLGNTLGLNNNQQSSLTNVFSNYIGGTNGIASLAKTNLKSYTQKLTSLNKGALGKMSNILTVAQYAKLLGIGGKGASKTSLLNGLTGGSSLSSGATSVLSGLLLNSI